MHRSPISVLFRNVGATLGPQAECERQVQAGLCGLVSSLKGPKRICEGRTHICAQACVLDYPQTCFGADTASGLKPYACSSLQSELGQACDIEHIHLEPEDQGRSTGDRALVLTPLCWGLLGIAN